MAASLLCSSASSMSAQERATTDNHQISMGSTCVSSGRSVCARVCAHVGARTVSRVRALLRPSLLLRHCLATLTQTSTRAPTHSSTTSDTATPAPFPFPLPPRTDYALAQDFEVETNSRLILLDGSAELLTQFWELLVHHEAHLPRHAREQGSGSVRVAWCGSFAQSGRRALPLQLLVRGTGGDGREEGVGGRNVRGACAAFTFSSFLSCSAIPRPRPRSRLGSASDSFIAMSCSEASSMSQ